MATTLSPDQIEARLRIVEEHMRAENAHDVEGIMQTFGENPTFVLNDQTFIG